MPPKKIDLIDTPAVTPQIIKGKLGGNKRPIEPETVINPSEKSLEKPSLISIGINNPPNAKIVTPEPPVIAVKNPHIITKTMGVPPGIQPNRA